MKHQRTNVIPLRWIGNRLGSIAVEFLMKCVYLDEENKHNLKYRFYGKLWKIFNKPYMWWGTYYTIDMDAIIAELDKDPVLNYLNSHNDEHGIPDWDKWQG
jgi:hypothetical protein